MIKVDVYNPEGEGCGQVDVDESVLGEVNVAVMRSVVRVYEANRRVGTKHVRSRGEIAATGHKLYRQKHTGNARAGSRVTNIRRGGGKAHAPKGKDWSLRFPRKARRAATRSALLARLRDGEVRLVEAPRLDAPKTRVVADLLKSLGVERPCLLVIAGEAGAIEVLWKSGRNIDGLTLRRVQDVNAYDLLRPRAVVFTREAFEAMMKACAS